MQIGPRAAIERVVTVERRERSVGVSRDRGGEHAEMFERLEGVAAPRRVREVAIDLRGLQAQRDAR